MKAVAIIIPVYKTEISVEEKISLESIVRSFSNRDIFYIMPPNLDLSSYNISDKIKTVSFNPGYFSSLEGYNRLMLDPVFYQSFIEYEYILIAQLDSFVFNDSLEEFIRLGYYYYGAPWFTSRINGWEKIFTSALNKEMKYAGNGGFSLRNTAGFLKVLSRTNSILTLSSLRLSFLRGKLSFPTEFQKFRSIGDLIKNYPRNEDIFWGIDVPVLFNWFRVAPVNISIRFAFDEDPGYLFKLTGGHLPMACHGWHNKHLSFWKEFISY